MLLTRGVGLGYLLGLQFLINFINCEIKIGKYLYLLNTYTNSLYLIVLTDFKKEEVMYYDQLKINRLIY